MHTLQMQGVCVSNETGFNTSSRKHWPQRQTKSLDHLVNEWAVHRLDTCIGIPVLPGSWIPVSWNQMHSKSVWSSNESRLSSLSHLILIAEKLEVSKTQSWNSLDVPRGFFAVDLFFWHYFIVPRCNQKNLFLIWVCGALKYRWHDTIPATPPKSKRPWRFLVYGLLNGRHSWTTSSRGALPTPSSSGFRCGWYEP